MREDINTNTETNRTGDSAQKQAPGSANQLIFKTEPKVFMGARAFFSIKELGYPRAEDETRSLSPTSCKNQLKVDDTLNRKCKILNAPRDTQEESFRTSYQRHLWRTAGTENKRKQRNEITSD